MRRTIVMFLTAVLVSGCFPSRTVNYSERGIPEEISSFTAVAKIHLDDGSVVLMRNGFTVAGDTVIGNGPRYGMAGGLLESGAHRIVFDSIAAMTYHQDDHNGGQVLGSALFGTWGPSISFLSLYCLVCPKCCFGCCPTVYIRDGSEQSIRAECFSYCISPYTQRGDLDLLARRWDPGDTLHMRIANEALETHYINSLSLLAVQHPEDSEVYPTDAGRIVAVRDLRPAAGVWNSRGADVTEAVRSIDQENYRSSMDIFSEQAVAAEPDWLAFDLPPMPGSDSVTVVLRLRNTLLSTVLFYDIVLASQGMQAMEWTRRMAENKVYALLFSTLYEQYSGIRCLSGTPGNLRETATIGDIGPIAWKEIALRIPAASAAQRIRLEFFPDNVMIDRIAWSADASAEASMHVQRLSPVRVTDYAGRDGSAALALLEKADDAYLIHEPGDNVDLTYRVPGSKGLSTSLLLASSGYYYEWLRGNWIRNAGTGKQLDIFDRKGILTKLRSRWLESHRAVAQSFFENRIPLKEVSR